MGKRKGNPHMSLTKHLPAAPRDFNSYTLFQQNVAFLPFSYLFNCQQKGHFPNQLHNKYSTFNNSAIKTIFNDDAFAPIT